MFKTLAKWIGAIPWWLLLIGGPALMIAVGVLTANVQTPKLLDSAGTPEMKAAIQQEIKRAEEQAALDFGRATVIKIQGISSDDDLKVELDQVLEEIKQAQQELNEAKREAAADVEAAKREAGQSGQAQIEAAETAAQAAVKEAEQQVAEAKRALAETIKQAAGARDGQAKSGGKDSAGNKANASDAEKKSGFSINIDLSDTPESAKSADVPKDSPKEAPKGDIGIIKKSGKPLHIHIGTPDIPLPPGVPIPLLPPELKAEIGSHVQSDIRRVLIGSSTVFVLLLLFITLIIAKSVISVNRALKARASKSEKEAQQASLSKQLMEAKLAAMQAQIEPHFLFNTLASVDHLIETDPPAASRMQKNLIAYLRAAIPQMRESSTTLGREAEMCRAYLNILQVRMESRLKFEINIPEELKNLPFPPMMLPTLTENAIKHGLEPKPEGGEIRVTAARLGNKLRVSVTDTGMGFSETPGSGLGLANIRERLQALYGSEAQLIIEPNQTSGTTATIEIPYPNQNDKGPDRR